MTQKPKTIEEVISDFVQVIDNTFGKKVNMLLYMVDSTTGEGNCASLGCPRCMLELLEESMDNNNIKHDGEDATGVTH